MSKASLVENNRKGEGNMKLEIFRNAEFGEVRTIIGEDGEPWVMLSDVCRVLEIKNPRQAKTRLNRSGVISNDVTLIYGYSSQGTPKYRESKATFINEANLYKLVFQSRKPQAERFADWVTGEVLPSIRKTGSYGLPQISEETKALVDIIEAEDKLSQALSIRRYREIVERPLLETIEEQKPKVEYTDNVLSSEGTMPLREIVKCFKNLSSQKANRILVEHNIIFRQKRADGKLGKVIPRQETQNKGYMKQATRIDNLGKTHQDYRWTELGKNFLVDFFQELGFVLIEK